MTKADRCAVEVSLGANLNSHTVRGQQLFRHIFRVLVQLHPVAQCCRLHPLAPSESKALHLALKLGQNYRHRQWTSHHPRVCTFPSFSSCHCHVLLQTYSSYCVVPLLLITCEAHLCCVPLLKVFAGLYELCCDVSDDFSGQRIYLRTVVHTELLNECFQLRVSALAWDGKHIVRYELL